MSMQWRGEVPSSSYMTIQCGEATCMAIEFIHGQRTGQEAGGRMKRKGGIAEGVEEVECGGWAGQEARRQGNAVRCMGEAREGTE